jgi:LmbE family N-acetylglucosaminyl deacetylase
VTPSAPEARWIASTPMATWVSFQAHPDDESIQSGGTLAKAARDGHRTVLVFGTAGEHGEVAEGFLADDETLAQRRRLETERSAEILGVARVEFLGYTDSGMMGTPENDLPGSFWTAELDEAAERLATILREEEADVLTIYDSDGGYGHPDHIQVHRVGVRAAQLAGTRHVLEATMNRDHLRRLMQAAVASGTIAGDDVPEVTELDTFGRPESVITTTVDVREFISVKRASMVAHASQITESSFFLAMPQEAFAESFGWEWYIRHGAPDGHRDDDLFAGVG